MNGFDWLNIAGLQSDSDLPPPPVSFGVTPTSSTSSLNLKAQEEAVTEHKREETPEETPEDLSVPLSLRADQLTKDEAKTYLRWYNDLVVRRGTNLIRLDDVFQFLRNFSISPHSRELLNRIFREVNALNVGEFFAFLRVIAHTILGKTPMRRLIAQPAPIPKPKSCLSTKRLQDQEEEEDDEDDTEKLTRNEPNKNLDFDSFATMLLTGENPSNKKKKKKKGPTKRIKFSDQVSVEPTEVKTVEPVKIDLSLPMDQLINRLPKKQEQPQHINEEEELKEMQDSFSHFQNIKNVDSALIHGTPANIPSIFFDEVNNPSPGVMSPNYQSPSPEPSGLRPLAPNHTGPVLPLAPSHTGPVRLMSPNHTGPVPFANSLLQPNMTGTQSSNGFLQPNYTGITEQQRVVSSPSPSLAPPPPAQRRARSSSSPIPMHDQHISLDQLAQAAMAPSSTQPQIQRTASPAAPAPPPPRRRGMSQSSATPPPPPPSRQTQTQNMPPPLPPKVELTQGYNYTPYQNGTGSNDSSTADILSDLAKLQNQVKNFGFQ